MPGTENVCCCYHCRHHHLHLLSTLGIQGCATSSRASAHAQGLGLSAQGSGAKACVCSNPPTSSKHSPFFKEGAASPIAF